MQKMEQQWKTSERDRKFVGRDTIRRESLRPPVGQVESHHVNARSLAEARKGFTSKLHPQHSRKTPPPVPPAGVMRIVRYESSAGSLGAYLTPDPRDGKKHPAIVWITGGDCNSIDEGCWTEGPPENEQSAFAFRNAGIVMMFPSLRGGNDNPGVKERFLGEVDDVVAAADYLAKQPFVEPDRIYLGGHSTGGTLVLLTAESTNRFRDVFSFGPVSGIEVYGLDFCRFDILNEDEFRLRSPIRWLHSVSTPVFVFEGTENGHLDSLKAMAEQTTNPRVRFFPIRGQNHFSILAPMTRLIAEKILHDEGPMTNVTFAEDEVRRQFTKR
jgi:acetyl esterase/lipase